MKGTALGPLAACALMTMSATLANASTSPPWTPPTHGARPPHAGEIRFETVRHHLPGDEISLGETYVGPAPEATPGGEPEIVAVPVYVPVDSQPAEPPSRGPHIIYIGKETPRQKTGFMPRVIYGDLPARATNGPEILYGDAPR